MRVTLPHMGNAWIPVKAIAEELGINLVVPPPTSRRTLSLGARYAPETACLPFKLTLGNMIEGLEEGADTVLMLGQYGPCRFGYYNKVQETIMKDLGFNFQMLKESFGILNIIKYLSNGASLARILKALHLGLVKLKALEELERLAAKVRPVERDRGRATLVYQESIKAIDRAPNARAIGRAKAEHLRELRGLPILPNRNPLKIGLTGEFFVVLDSFANMDIEIELGKLGVEVQHPHSVWAWLSLNPLARAFGLREKDRCRKAAAPYLSRNVGGDGQQSVGEKVLHARDWDGIVHLEPFGCLPETVARNIMPSTRERLPLLNIIYDEYTGKAGVMSRLEAFLDMVYLQRGRRMKKCV